MRACAKRSRFNKKTNINFKKIINLSSEYRIKRLIFFLPVVVTEFKIQILWLQKIHHKSVSLYAESKISMEDYLAKNYDTNLAYTILRPSTVHGLSVEI